jgi:hypothetical protein
MEDVLELIGLFVFAAAVIALAAGVTWIVVRFLPAEKDDPKPKPAEPAA